MEGTPRELNHLSTWRNRNQIRDSPSSGERTGKSLNRPHVIGVNRCVVGVVGPALVWISRTGREVKNLIYSRTPLGRATRGGESPVGEMDEASWEQAPEYRGARETLRESGRTTFQG